VVGLLLYGKDARTQQKKNVDVRDSVSSFVKRISSWFKGEF
jgi:cell division protein FtsA